MSAGPPPAKQTPTLPRGGSAQGKSQGSSPRQRDPDSSRGTACLCLFPQGADGEGGGQGDASLSGPPWKLSVCLKEVCDGPGAVPSAYHVAVPLPPTAASHGGLPAALTGAARPGARPLVPRTGLSLWFLPFTWYTHLL